MKKYILTAFLACAFTTFSFAQEKLTINTSTSEIKWSGDYTFYFGGHYGTINFKEGYFVKQNDVITGGSFTIDMNSIICEDVENGPDGKNGLVEHLKNDDFFDVGKYPTAKLVITSVSYHDSTHFLAKADMTIKGITMPVKFQAEVDFEKQQMLTRFKIDRTRWGINYNSKIKDNAISEAIGFEVKIRL